MQHIDRIVWEPINWLPESPDQYPGGVPIAKPEIAAVWFSEAPPHRQRLSDPLPQPDLAIIGFLLDDSIYITASDDLKTPLLIIPCVSVAGVFDALVELYRRATGKDASAGMQRIAEIIWKPLDDRPVTGGRSTRLWVDLPDDGASPTLIAELAASGDNVAIGVETSDEQRNVLVVPLIAVPQLAEALIYVHRRTHEHDYEDAG